MKTVTLAIILIVVSCVSSYAEDAPTFIKVGASYILTTGPGVTLPHLVTIIAAGGGGWFRVTTPSDTNPNAHAATGLGDRWINFNQLVEVREAIPKKGPK